MTKMIWSHPFMWLNELKLKKETWFLNTTSGEEREKSCVEEARSPEPIVLEFEEKSLGS